MDHCPPGSGCMQWLNRLGIFRVAVVIILMAIVILLPLAAGGDSPQVQEIKGRLELGENLLYQVASLEPGDRLSVYLQGLTDTLDPFAAILKPGVDLKTLRREYFPELAKQSYFFQAKPEALFELNNKFFVAWDDNSGKGHASRLTFTAPASGEYCLLVGSTPWRLTFGDFRMLLGLNAPKVSSGQARPTGHILANHTKAVWQAAQRVDEIDGKLTPEQQYRSVGLYRVYRGETIYVHLEITSGTLPTIVLQDNSGIPLVSGHLEDRKNVLTLIYTFAENDNSPRLRVFYPPTPGKPPQCTYRLLVGINNPQVLSGQAPRQGRPLIQHPIPVKIGLRMDQISHVDQKEENFGVVASLKLIWRDPALGFNPEKCQCFIKTYSGDAFQRFVGEKGLRWPEFALFNQQGNRWYQNRLVMVWPDGWCIYFERFSVTLQAPDFDFKRFPFDRQDFYVHIDSLRPDWIYVFEELPGFSEVGKQLGEEEWVVTGFDTQFTTQTQTTDLAGSRFSFQFQAKRHLTFYSFRIFLPIFIILLVSWFTFFLKDYSKRVDVAAGNLLLFIAFNFTIAGLLPRLGYLTFLDLILIITFVITSFILLLAVVLKRLEMDGRIELVNRVDALVISFYPLAYFMAAVIVTLMVW
ncbi:MAG: hypothetical protein PHW74_11785 [Desulfobacca sp.]|nr:hypothetical protein [Desulfobacca sp.]